MKLFNTFCFGLVKFLVLEYNTFLRHQSLYSNIHHVSLIEDWKPQAESFITDNVQKKTARGISGLKEHLKVFTHSQLRES